jgi:protein ImuB
MSSEASALYACLRTPRDPEIAVTVAKEFSPRLQRYGSECVVLDISGLGRLLGDPQTIGDELASRIADLSDAARSADSSHRTRTELHGTRISRITDSFNGTRIARITESSGGSRISRITDSFDGTRISRISADLQGVDYGPGQSALSEEDLQRSARSAPREEDPRWRSRVAVAPTQIGTRVLSSAYPGLTVVTRDVESALAPVRLEVLRQVCAEIHGTDDQWRSAQSASREMKSAQSASREMKSAQSASREIRSAQSASREMKSAQSASRETKSAQSASREMRSAQSASREMKSAQSASSEIRSARSASREQDPRSGKVFEVMERWGLSTLGELAVLPAGMLSARLGQAVIELQRMAKGVDVGPLVPDPDVPRFLERIELEWPIDGLEPLAFVLARLLEPLSLALERADRAAAALHLRLRLVDRTVHARLLQLPAALRDPRVLRTLLVLDLESHPPGAAIDIVTIEVDPAPGRVLQYSLLERARPSAETLTTLTARLGALVGESRCGCPVLLDSHGPDAFEMRRFAPDERAPVALSSATPASVTSARDPLVAPDTPVTSAFKRKDQQLEDAVLRRFRPPVAIRVAVDDGRPRYVFIDRRGMPGGHIEQCAGPWRSSGAWWDARPWNRDEWEIALGDGSVCRVFQARETGQWFLDGVFD